METAKLFFQAKVRGIHVRAWNGMARIGEQFAACTTRIVCQQMLNLTMISHIFSFSLLSILALEHFDIFSPIESGCIFEVTGKQAMLQKL